MKFERTALFMILTIVAYVAIQSFCVGAPYFPADDLAELAFVRWMPNKLSLLGTDVFLLFRPVKNILFACFSIFGDGRVEMSRTIAIGIGVATYFPILSFFRKVFGNSASALAAAAVYLLAPTQVSCVAWLSCINIQIMAGFAAVALVAHDEGKNVKASCFYALSLCSYECSIALPGIMLLIDLLLRPNRRFSRRWLSMRPYVIYLVVGILYLSVRFVLSGATGVHGNFPYDVSRWQISFASASFLRDHLSVWFWPFGRMAVMGYFSPWIADYAELGLCWLLPIALLLVAFLCRRGRPLVTFGILSFFVGYLPVSNITGIGNGPYGDYYLALGGLGLAVLYVDIVRFCLSAHKWRMLCLSAAVGLIGVRVFAIPESARYAYLWGNDVSAYRNSVKTFPASVNNKLVLLKSLARRNEKVLTEEILNSIEADVDSAHGEKASFYLLKALFAGNVKYDYHEAMENIEKYKIALPEPPQGMAWYHYYKGCLIEDLGGDVKSAGAEYLLAIEAEMPRKTSAPYFDRAARFVAIEGDVNRAIGLWRKALFYDDTLVTAHMNIATALAEIGDMENALHHRQRVRELSLGKTVP